MPSQIKLNVSTPKEIFRRWSARAWKNAPALAIAIPFPGGVLFGAEEGDSSESVSFFLDPNDAQIIGQKLVNAAKQARAK